MIFRGPFFELINNFYQDRKFEKEIRRRT